MLISGFKLKRSHSGFTLIELVVVISIIAILTIVAAPKILDLRVSAKIQVLNGIAASLRSSAEITQAKAHAQGIIPATSNPPGGQGRFIINFPFGSAEIDWRNLCPESRAELGDRLTMLDFLNLSTDDITSQTNNQYTLIGYDIPGFSVPTNQGCYVIYNSFGAPDCTVTVVTVDC